MTISRRCRDSEFEDILECYFFDQLNADLSPDATPLLGRPQESLAIEICTRYGIGYQEAMELVADARQDVQL